jgi:carbon-monoxide dehydrogenase medium subunit
MKPAPFTYYAPESTDEAVSLLSELGDEAKLIGGGQSLVPMMNMRLARPSALIDVLSIPGLDGIEVREANGGAQLAFGAAVRHADAMSHPDVTSRFPMLTRALEHVGHAAIRNQGTLGGSIVHADPAAELPAVLLAADAEIVAKGPNGTRTIGAEEFFVTYFSTALEEDELAVEIRLPLPSSTAHRWGFAEVARRHGDFALVGAAVNLDVTETDTVRSARIALLGAGEVPVRVVAAEARLVGESLGDERVIEDVAQIVTESLDPPSDVHASSAYRKEVAGVLIRRCLRGARESEAA